MTEEETKEELKETLQNLQNDYSSLGIGIELLAEEIYGDFCSVDKLKKCIEDVELWASNLENVIYDLDEARIIFQKKEIINSLEN